MMVLLILGVLLWAGAHLFKRVEPGPRARLGDRGKGIVALALFASIILMVIGYRGADFVPIYAPPAFLVHVNNLLMLLAVYLFAASGMQTWVASKMRHPMLGALKIWALAHLLVNGDLASLILFGGMLAWGVTEMIMINKAEPDWQRPTGPFPVGKEIGAVVGAVLVYGLTGMIHTMLGHPPFGR